MHYYHAYTVDMVLNEYACRYYLMLDQALKIQAQDAHEQIVIALTPHMTPENRKKVLDSYLRLIGDGDERPSDAIIKSDRQRLRGLLRGK